MVTVLKISFKGMWVKAGKSAGEEMRQPKSRWEMVESWTRVGGVVVEAIAFLKYFECRTYRESCVSVQKERLRVNPKFGHEVP